MNNDIGIKIKNVRRSKHISQINLSKKAGIAQSTLSYIENGKRIPQFGTLSAICRGLDTSVLELMVSNESATGIRIFEENKELGIDVQGGRILTLSEFTKSDLYELEKKLFNLYLQKATE